MTSVKNIFPGFSTESAVEAYLQSVPRLWDYFGKLPETVRSVLYCADGEQSGDI